jgi:RNA polymerase sigma factor (sigma-70 family)
LRDSDGSQPADATAGPPKRFTPNQIAELHKQWAPAVRAFLWGLTRNPEQAEELLQATFAKLVEAGDAVDEASVRGWLFKVAHSEAMLWRRKAGVHERAIQKLIPTLNASDHSEPWAKLLRAEEAERVRHALHALPYEQQYVVQQRIYADKTFAVIAHELGVPIGTVLTRMRLALTKLEKALRPTLGPTDR